RLGILGAPAPYEGNRQRYRYHDPHVRLAFLPLPGPYLGAGAPSTCRRTVPPWSSTTSAGPSWGSPTLPWAPSAPTVGFTHSSTCSPMARLQLGDPRLHHHPALPDGIPPAERLPGFGATVDGIGQSPRRPALLPPQADGVMAQFGQGR